MDWDAFLLANGYSNVLRISGQQYAALAPFGFTTAIITGQVGDWAGYGLRWCYHTHAAALAALEAWAATGFAGEPLGWHRDPVTGRRISESADEIDGNGKRVGAVGVMYWRW